MWHTVHKNQPYAQKIDFDMRAPLRWKWRISKEHWAAQHNQAYREQYQQLQRYMGMKYKMGSVQSWYCNVTFVVNNNNIIVHQYIPYSAYISRVFNFANFAGLESFAKLIQRIFWHFEVEPHWRRIEVTFCTEVYGAAGHRMYSTAIRVQSTFQRLGESRYLTWLHVCVFAWTITCIEHHHATRKKKERKKK